MKSKQVFCSYSDPSVLVLTEKGIEDPHAYITVYDLKSYTIQHLKTNLMYRRDSLKNLETLKDAKVKILQYFRLRTENKLIDQTPNKMFLIKKAKLMDLNLGKEYLSNLPNTPTFLICQNEASLMACQKFICY